MCTVSIIVSVYNVEEYLDACVMSLIKQTFSNIEIILVDDGSTDKSSKICEKYLNLDNRIVVIHQNNQGVSAARNNGLEKASGEWVSFVDGDDYVSINMIEKLIEETEKSIEIDLVMGSYYSVKNSKISREHFFKGDKVIGFERKDVLIMMAAGINVIGTEGTTNIGVPWAKLYRKSVIDQYKLTFQPELKRMQDTIFNISFFRTITEVRYIDIPIYYYRINEDSAVRRYYEDFDRIAQDIILALERQMCLCDDIENKEAIINFKKMGLLIETIKLSYVHKECKLALKQKIMNIKKICESSFYDNTINDISNLYLNRKYILLKNVIKLKWYWLVYMMIWVKNFWNKVKL